MLNEESFFDLVMQKLTDPYIRGRIRRALDMELVLDTWLNGEQQENFSMQAHQIITRSAMDLARQAMETGSIFPGSPMPNGYIRAVFQETLSSTALYQAQKRKGARNVDEMDAANADAILRRFVRTERDGLTSIAGIFFVISAHEDLNAIRYYRRMPREDFLLGTTHRAWSDMMLTNQLDVYRRMQLVREIATEQGTTLELSKRGLDVWEFLRNLLEESGEFEWRSNAQRWVIFGETDYDREFQTVLPDANRLTKEFVESLAIPPGARVLEIGAGTGRATFDLGLADRVAEAGGTLVALEPCAALLSSLRGKCDRAESGHVRIVQGVAEALPFPDRSFDLVIAVAVLHFTDLEKAVTEMVRVTRPGGWIATRTPVKSNLFTIPMVARWLHPLRDLSTDLGIHLGERQGVEKGKIEAGLRNAGVNQVQTKIDLARITASDPRAFMQFILKGAAVYQNIFSRLPFQERWSVLHELEESGPRMAEDTAPEDQQTYYFVEVVYAQLPPSFPLKLEPFPVTTLRT